MRQKELYDITLMFGGETPGAVKVREDVDSPWLFLPKSQVEFRVKGRTVEVTIPAWLLIEKGLEHLA